MEKMFFSVFLFISFFSFSQNITYPYAVNYFNLKIEGQNVKMAFMDVKPSTGNGGTVLLFHGKNFNGFYWKDVIPFLTGAGYRVIVPDQVGWGKSSKPNLHYSFFMLANNNAKLLDSLGITKVFVVGHSMGGMLATRFTLMFPQKVQKLVLENPIGLEDYSAFVPYKSLDDLYKNESNQTYESIKKYQQSYYPAWKEEYEPYVQAQASPLKDTNFAQIAIVNALTYQIVYEQPVVYSFDSLRIPTFLIIGQADRTVVGKNSLTEEQKKVYGNYPLLGRKTTARIKGSQLVELHDVGHIPHIQELMVYKQHLLSFLNNE
ncbi:MAG TPA: alpha/beta hydrolase [Segetibacter sp.]|nr:alpha/beta hydrolase [Segetibacter sp.]